jgi:hypothetical protein
MTGLAAMVAAAGTGRGCGWLCAAYERELQRATDLAISETVERARDKA